MAVPNTKEATFTDGSGLTGDILNINTQAGQIEIPNGKPIKFFSDAYVTASGQIANGTVATAQSSSAAAIATGNTITTAGVGVARVSPAAAVTGIILQAGTIPGQEVWVINEAVAANTVTFAAAGTSNVADGASSAITGLVARKFVWDSGTSLWYRAG